MAELRRAALWEKAVNPPGLPDDAREALALKLPVAESKFPIPRLTRQDIEEIQSTVILAKDQSGRSLAVVPLGIKQVQIASMGFITCGKDLFWGVIL